MSSDADKVFDQVTNKLRKKKGLCPPTPEEAAEAFKKTKPIPVSEEEQAAIVDAMLSEETPIRGDDASEPWSSTPLDQEIDADCQAICRNPGEGDEDTERLEAEIEQELLKEDDDEA
jgi:hypothetical protein